MKKIPLHIFFTNVIVYFLGYDNNINIRISSERPFQVLIFKITIHFLRAHKASQPQIQTANSKYVVNS